MLGSAGRPFQGAATQKMDMKMRDAFTAIRTIINDQAETRVIESFLFRDGLCDKDQMTQKRFVFGFGLGHARDFLFGDDQDVNRSLRLDVMKGQAKIIFKGNPGGNLPGDDFGKNRAHDFQ